MNLTIHQLRAFVLVVKEGSFTGAGQAMHLTQSAVSLLLRDLEEALGSHLIDRTTRSIAVTAIGQEFFASAQRILDDLEQASQTAHGVLEIVKAMDFHGWASARMVDAQMDARAGSGSQRGISWQGGDETRASRD